MTRQEFIRNTTTWRELIDFCYIYDCSVCDDILARTDLPGFVNSDLIDYQGQYSWTTIRDLLFAIVDTADYYCREGFLDYVSVDDSFEAYKADVLAWCDEDASIFDEDENEAGTTNHIFDPFEDDILDLDDDYLIVAVGSDTGSENADDNELQDDEHSPEEILELLMTHFQYTKTE